jgi:hypothetical protein
LKRDFPDPATRAAVARAIMTVAAAHETAGLSLVEAQRGLRHWEERTKELDVRQQDDSNRRPVPGQERERDRPFSRDRSRDRDL